MTHEEKLKFAREANAAGNYGEAERIANQVLAETQVHNKQHADALCVLAESARQQGKYDQAKLHAEAALALAEEHNHTNLKSKAWNTLGNLHSNLGSYHKALEYFGKVLDLHEESGEKLGAAGTISNIGTVYAEISSYDKALDYFSKALPLAEKSGNKSFTAIITGNIGYVYSHLGSYNQALEYYGKALSLYEALGSNSGVAKGIGDIGDVYMYLGLYDKALEYHGKALALHEELGEKSDVANSTANIGNVYVRLGSYDKAFEHYGKALALHEELGEKTEIANITGNIGVLYAKKEFTGFDATRTEKFLLRAIALCEEIGAMKLLYTNHQHLADLYKIQERWKEFALHFEKYHELEKAVQSEEAKNQAMLMEQRRQTDEREKNLAVERAKHEATEALLHNVLPPSIAHRMIQGENLIAEKLDHVSVLFADIVNFTNLSQRITAEELVAGLDRIFSEFDALAEKYGLEKIKTIGDAYMVVSGAPVPRADHAEAMAQFALEIVESMKQFTSISTGEEIQIRIGIHSGEVVAGVIGKKKFAYDLWGDAVNTAARMESHGEAGKIHVSEEFVRNFTPALSKGEGEDSFSFTFGEGWDGVLWVIPRGEMKIKGKGMMKTYFLEKKA